MHVLFLGASFTGRSLVELLAEQEQAGEQGGRAAELVAGFGARISRVSFLSRTPDALAERGLQAYERSAGLRVDLVVDTVPELVAGRLAYQRELELLLREHGSLPIIHVSSTSVYPDGGRDSNPEEPQSVDEGTPPAPANERGARRLNLERAWQNWNSEVRVLRSAGLYGPRRALSVSFARGDRGRLATGNRIVSRIHVYDLLRLLLAMSDEQSPRLVNGVDEQPSANAVTFGFLEELLGEHLEGDFRNEPAYGRAVRSRHAKRLLGSYLFPTFREGFSDALRRYRQSARSQ